MLLFVNGKQHVIAEMMPAMHAELVEIKINFGAFRKPQLFMVRNKLYRHIFDRNVLRAQPDVRDGGDKVCFQAFDLECLR